MVVKDRFKKNEDLEKKRREIISRGSVEYAFDREKRKCIALRMPQYMIDGLDDMAETLPGQNRTSLILKAIRLLLEKGGK